MVTVRIPTALRPLSGGREEVQVAGDSSLRQVLLRLEAECPGIKERLLDEDGAGIHPGIAIFINDDQESEGLIQHVPADATLHILPAMGGGALRAGYSANALFTNVLVAHAARPYKRSQPET